MRTRYLGEINPTQLTDFKNQILYSYLHKNKSKIYFKADEKLKINIKGKVYVFKLTHAIFHRKSTGGLQEDRFEIVANRQQLGQGAEGRVYKIKGTLAPTPQRKFNYKNNKRVVKVTDCDDAEEFAKSEAILTKQISKRGAKDLVIATIEENKKTGLLVMHQLKGVNLYDVVEGDFSNVFILSIHQRINISIQILIALQEIHDRSIIHRDIKFENIFIDLLTFKASIFDFGLSKRKGEKKYERVGSPLYLPPEQADELESDERSDMFSTVLLLALIWKVKIIYPEATNVINSDAYINATDEILKEEMLRDAYLADSHNLRFDFDDLYNNSVLSVSRSAKDSIKFLVENNLTDDKNKRFSVDQALEIFQHIRLEQKITALKGLCGNKYDNSLVEVQRIALEVRKNYRDLVNLSVPITIDDIKNVITTDLADEHITDDPVLIEEFITTLGIDAFNGLQTKASIIEKISTIYNQLAATVNELEDMIEKLEALKKLSENYQPRNVLLHNLVESLIKETQIIWQKNRHYKFDIDDMIVLNNRYTVALEKFKQANSLLPVMLDLGIIAKEISKNQEDKASVAYHIKLGIWTYIHLTFDKKNLRKQDQALSQQRINDMYEILAILNANGNESPAAVIKAVKAQLNKIKRGVFNTNLPLFRSFGGSDLVDFVNLAIKDYLNVSKNSHIPKRRCCF